MNRGDYAFFVKTLTKKQELKDAWEKIKTLSSEDEIDTLDIPKWTKKHFKVKFRYEVLKSLTPEQIAALMQKLHKPLPKPIYPVMKYTGSGTEIGKKLKINVDQGDYFAVIDSNMVKVNRNCVKVSSVDFEKLIPADRVGDMEISEYNDVVGQYLTKKYYI